MKRKIGLIAAAACGMALASVSAHAVPIVGTISFADGFDAIPSPPSLLCIVDCGTDTFDINNVENVYTAGSGTLAFLGTASALASDLDGGALPFDIYTTDTGFVFRVTSYSLASSTPLSCDDTLCTDTIEYDFSGVVSGPAGLDPTKFVGVWTANGSCLAADGTSCSAASQSGSWSSSIVATGETAVPEPGSLALLGLSLVGLGAARRRKA